MDNTNHPYLVLVTIVLLGMLTKSSTLSCLPECHCKYGQDRGYGVEMDCRDGKMRRLPRPEGFGKNKESLIIAIFLTNNSIEHLDVVFLSQWSSLEILDLSQNNIKSLSKSTEDETLMSNLKIVNLSFNSLQVLHGLVFAGFPSLITLNLSHNQIHTISESALVLPSLLELDLSYNQISEAVPHLFDTSPNLDIIRFSHNRLSRLLGNYTINDILIFKIPAHFQMELSLCWRTSVF